MFAYLDLSVQYSVELQEQNITHLFVTLEDDNLQVIKVLVAMVIIVVGSALE